jgi:taurine--2-oxoglutarate transaminase
MMAALRAMQERLPVVGDVRGGHGLFAVVELVKDRATREPVSPWPQTHPSLEALVKRGRAEGVSFAVRGNLVLLAPPLVVREEDLMGALALLERLLASLEWS